jgi:hypothetical protein
VNFSFHNRVQTGSGAKPASYSMGQGLFLAVKRRGREIDKQRTIEARYYNALWWYILKANLTSIWYILNTLIISIEETAKF